MLSTKAVARSRDIRILVAWNPTEPLDSIFETAWTLSDRRAVLWWDALIASSAMALKCGYLLTGDFQGGRVVDRGEALNPFSHDSPSRKKGALRSTTPAVGLLKSPEQSNLTGVVNVVKGDSPNEIAKVLASETTG